ncbi:aspartyl-phosphate phosphatase Spo0E family protein [Aquibacillus albus]|uniref:Spo0E family sporulation regulatory protein-aspartic acid phosphatase n=1 Tax=Aquibacillus albus TaxID=1168171 RepID=A0ABS2N3K0_9BACI|nr:aspartyl-phosphate phosphatase Spo0E family protein [Aquibacillus albus]MBM7572710.1 hypothetical protein [Aquibacillus albus]
MTKNRRNLRIQIELKRKEMIQCGKKYGLDHHKTLYTSKELDILINKFLKK